MPKMKTKSAAKKRFRFTASGKAKHGVAGKRHGMSKRGNRFLRQAKYNTIEISSPSGGGIYSKIAFQMIEP